MIAKSSIIEGIPTIQSVIYLTRTIIGNATKADLIVNNN